MDAGIEWLENTRSVHFGIALMGALFIAVTAVTIALGLALGGVFLAIPVILVTGLVAALGVLVSQPRRVGFQGEMIWFHYYYGMRQFATYRISEARFGLPARHAQRPDGRRRYTLALVTFGGRATAIGHLDGPVAARIMARLEPSKVRLRVAARHRHVEFRPEGRP